MALDQEVIELHHIARKIENNIGAGQLSQDLRNIADRLHELIKVHYVQDSSTADNH